METEFLGNAEVILDTSIKGEFSFGCMNYCGKGTSRYARKDYSRIILYKKAIMHTFLINCKKVSRDKTSVIIGGGVLLVFLWLGFRFIDFEVIRRNIGFGFALTEILLHGILTILFSMVVAAQTYKFKYFKTISKRQSSGGIIGSFLGILVTGCPSCTITIASYLGIASIFTIFPWYGLEVKILGVLLLFIIVWKEYKNLLICALKRK